jgi:opacity protein-like surface antigen
MKIAAACLALALPQAAHAEEWTFDGTLYGWLPGLNATLDTPFGEVESDQSGSDALEDLDMAFMGTFEARRGSWGILFDLIYADLSDDQATPLDLAFRDLEVETRVTAFSGYALYRVAETPRATVDLGVGFRTFSASLEANLKAERAAEDRNYDADEIWTVPLVAARAIVPFNSSWFATGSVDVGATTGDASTWQAIATVGYHVNERWSLQAGYRYMDIQKEIDGLDADIVLSGPLIGASYRF